MAYYAVALDSGKLIPVAKVPLGTRHRRISLDGRQIAYSVADGEHFSIRIADVGADPATARVLCKDCGLLYGFSPDGQFLLYDPEAHSKDDSPGKSSVRLLEVATGKDSPWMESPTESLAIADVVGGDSSWLVVTQQALGAQGKTRASLVPWRVQAPPRSEWIDLPLSGQTAKEPAWRASPSGEFYYLFEDSKVMGVRFDSRKSQFGVPFEVKLAPGSKPTFQPSDDWSVRGPGLVFSHEETASSSLWLMNLPR